MEIYIFFLMHFFIQYKSLLCTLIKLIGIVVDAVGSIFSEQDHFEISKSWFDKVFLVVIES